MVGVHSSAPPVWRLGRIVLVVGGVVVTVIFLILVWFFLQTYPVSSHGRETIVPFDGFGHAEWNTRQLDASLRTDQALPHGRGRDQKR